MNAKREELLRYRTSLEAEIRKVTCDLDHVDAAIRLFYPDTALAAFKAYVVQYRAKKGTVTKFVLNMIREAVAPPTALQITEAWIADRGLECDESTRVVLRKRIGATLISLRNSGVLRNDGKGADGFKTWVAA